MAGSWSKAGRKLQPSSPEIESVSSLPLALQPRKRIPYPSRYTYYMDGGHRISISARGS
jgi:hypothetical protein